MTACFGNITQTEIQEEILESTDPSSVAQTQMAFSGRVIDYVTKEAIPDVVIESFAPTERVRTRRDGAFVLRENVRSNTVYELRASKAGYAESVARVLTPSNGTRHIDLQLMPLQGEPSVDASPRSLLIARGDMAASLRVRNVLNTESSWCVASRSTWFEVSSSQGVLRAGENTAVYIRLVPNAWAEEKGDALQGVLEISDCTESSPKRLVSVFATRQDEVRFQASIEGDFGVCALSEGEECLVEKGVPARVVVRASNAQGAPLRDARIALRYGSLETSLETDRHGEAFSRITTPIEAGTVPIAARLAAFCPTQGLGDCPHVVSALRVEDPTDITDPVTVRVPSEVDVEIEEEGSLRDGIDFSSDHTISNRSFRIHIRASSDALGAGRIRLRGWNGRIEWDEQEGVEREGDALWVSLEAGQTASLSGYYTGRPEVLQNVNLSVRTEWDGVGVARLAMQGTLRFEVPHMGFEFDVRRSPLSCERVHYEGRLVSLDPYDDVQQRSVLVRWESPEGIQSEADTMLTVHPFKEEAQSGDYVEIVSKTLDELEGGVWRVEMIFREDTHVDWIELGDVPPSERVLVDVEDGQDTVALGEIVRVRAYVVDAFGCPVEGASMRIERMEGDVIGAVEGELHAEGYYTFPWEPGDVGRRRLVVESTAGDVGEAAVRVVDFGDALTIISEPALTFPSWSDLPMVVRVRADERDEEFASDRVGFIVTERLGLACDVDQLGEAVRSVPASLILEDTTFEGALPNSVRDALWEGVPFGAYCMCSARVLLGGGELTPAACAPVDVLADESTEAIYSDRTAWAWDESVGGFCLFGQMDGTAFGSSQRFYISERLCGENGNARAVMESSEHYDATPVGTSDMKSFQACLALGDLEEIGGPGNGDDDDDKDGPSGPDGTGQNANVAGPGVYSMYFSSYGRTSEACQEIVIQGIAPHQAVVEDDSDWRGLDFTGYAVMPEGGILGMAVSRYDGPSEGCSTDILASGDPLDPSHDGEISYRDGVVEFLETHTRHSWENWSPSRAGEYCVCATAHLEGRVEVLWDACGVVYYEND